MHDHGYQTTEVGIFLHCSKTGHKKDSYLKKYLKFISDQYKLKENEISLIHSKKVFLVGKKCLC